MLNKAEGIYRCALGDDHKDLAVVRSSMGGCQERQGDLEGTLASAREVITIYSKLGASFAGPGRHRKLVAV
jgi:hypothetical protein